MKSIRRREMVLAAALSTIAGFLDAVGFLRLGGYFVSFMSGNTTRMASSAALSEWAMAGRAAGLIGLFFGGVVLGSLLSRIGDGRLTVLWATTALVGIAAAVHDTIATPPPLILIAVAMGVINATFQKGGEVTVGLTYMTGTLVKAGQRLVDAFFGGSRTLWIRYLLLWVGLAAGSIIGAFLYHHMGLAVLWIAFGLLAAISAVTTALRRRDRV